MPQLDFSLFPSQIFWLAVALVITFLIVSRVALPRIGGILAERQGTIGGDLAAAEELKGKAKDLDAATAKADADISAKTADSEKRIAEIQAGAAAAVSEVARDTAGALIGALGGSADEKSIAAAVTARLKG